MIPIPYKIYFSKKASSECFGFVVPALRHALDLLKGDSDKVNATHVKVQTSGHVCPHQNRNDALSISTTKVDSTNVAGRVRKSPFPMISVEEAQNIVLGHCSTLGIIKMKFSEAHGFILAEDVFATDPLPPFPASIKDG